MTTYDFPVTTYDFGNGPVPARRHPNGGGWVADTSTVDETAFVGPNATVHENATVYGDAVALEAMYEIERLQQVCRRVYEVWAGSEGIPAPETAAEAYLLSLVEAMRDEAKEGLRNA